MKSLFAAAGVCTLLAACATTEASTETTAVAADSGQRMMSRSTAKPRLLTEENRQRRQAVVQGSRIINGTPVKPGGAPYQVSLFLKEAGPYQGHNCGGTMIQPGWVLTAAHCVDDDRTYGVYAGSTERKSGGVSFDIAEVIIHEGWKQRPGNDNDIALVRLAGPSLGGETERGLRTAGRIRELKLVDSGMETRQVQPNTDVRVTGWGLTEEGNFDSIPDQLMEIYVPVIDRDVCNEPERYNGEITENMICAGVIEGDDDERKDSCQGDSGGPLAVSDGQGGWALAGVVSWGIGCAREGLPGVYTRVSRYTDWIARKIGGAGG